MSEHDTALVRAMATLSPGGAEGQSGSPAADVPAAGDEDAWWRVFDAQATSRHLDTVARELQAAGRGFYTIGSAGHESNAWVAEALRPTDPALLHYRSGAFYVARAAQVAGATPVRDVLQGLMCAADEPIAGGRHKVFGHPSLSIIPQTSTIASHLPRAVGLAVSLHRAHRLGASQRAARVRQGDDVADQRAPGSTASGSTVSGSTVAGPAVAGPAWPEDAVVVCSFGDASANHSTAVGAINAALNTVYRGLPVPLLLVCEDNGRGISVPTPDGWIATAFSARQGLRYLTADGADAAAVQEAAAEAAGYVRARRRPVFLHLTTVRYGGHAGSDAEISYRTSTEITADYARDPILGTARLLVDRGVAAGDELVARFRRLRSQVDAVADELGEVRMLASATEVTASLAPRSPDLIRSSVGAFGPPSTADDGAESNGAQSNGAQSNRRDADNADSGRAADDRPARTLAESINATLADALAADRRVVLFGEDVGRKGGVYGVTRGLQRRFGAARVFDTLLDEQSVLGLGLGAGLAGLLPIPEIQYLAYLHNAEDQLRGEAATLSFFSRAQYRNPMVVRIAGLAYQKGFGGHFHNDNAVAVLRDIPGLVVACPARGDDASAMLRTCLAAADVDGTVSAFLEPIALYHARDLFSDGDGEWLSAAPDQHVPIGRARVHAETDADDLTIVTFGNGVPMSLRVARRLAERDIKARVVDLRWLSPLPVEDVLREAEATGRVLVADETRASGGVSEGVLAALNDARFQGAVARVTSGDSFIPLGPAARHVLLGEDDIEKTAIELVTRPARPTAEASSDEPDRRTAGNQRRARRRRIWRGRE
ncbi:thiamine pyrophosphate-dependent enzyme [Phytoactinopolyspora halotolerans]|uniref:MFS transporter n=1 Tax=Phytoactinopolyspora halotolerans TaxID=1981512 RepID=A0A6L9S7E2_9ACTN|nr:thiamine pyrophosphate-dependent enzyme [Phytoactinopolyspora halotolerans]NEE01395.1 MFS transporter [Phytoactinopolyspora halotolerans]